MGNECETEYKNCNILSENLNKTNNKKVERKNLKGCVEFYHILLYFIRIFKHLNIINIKILIDNYF